MSSVVVDLSPFPPRRPRTVSLRKNATLLPFPPVRRLLQFVLLAGTKTMAHHEERFIPPRQKLDQLSVVKDYSAIPRLEYRCVVVEWSRKVLLFVAYLWEMMKHSSMLAIFYSPPHAMNN